MRAGFRAVWAALIAMSVMSAMAGEASAASGHVYIMRGIAGMFSNGMDEIAAKLKRRGVDATVHAHGEYDRLATEAAALHRKSHGPIVIIGHSLGADAAVEMAELLKQARVPVALVVTFSPTLVMPAPTNVAQIVNYYQAGSIFRGRITPAPGFHGSIRNVNLDGAAGINHFNMDDAERLQNETIAKVLAITGGRRATASAAATPTKSTQ
jgi:hypothetical protein